MTDLLDDMNVGAELGAEPLVSYESLAGHCIPVGHPMEGYFLMVALWSLQDRNSIEDAGLRNAEPVRRAVRQVWITWRNVF